MRSTQWNRLQRDVAAGVALALSLIAAACGGSDSQSRTTGSSAAATTTRPEPATTTTTAPVGTSLIGMTYVHEIPGVPTRNSELVDAPDGVRMAFSHVIVDGHDVLLAASENGWWSQSLSGEYEPAPQPVPRTVTIRVDETLTVTPRPLACTSNDQIVVNNLASSAVAVEWGLQNDAGYLPGVVNCQQGVLVVRAQPPRNAYDYNAALRECEETVRSWYFREPNSGECEALASQSAPIPAPLEVRVPIEARTITLGHQVVATLDLGTGIERTILGWCSRDSVADSMLFVTATASGTPTRAFRYNPTADSFAVESLDSVTCNEPMAD